MNKALTGAGAGLVLLLIFMAGVPSCTHETQNLDRFETVCFERDVLPVFQNGCATTNCHDAITHRDGLDLSHYGGILEEIEPGNPDGSEIYQVITTTGPERMPPDHALAEADRIRIRLWILQGAQNTQCNPDSTGRDLTMKGGPK